MNISIRRFLFSGLSLWLVVTVIGAYYLVHLKKYINFGVDLVGGTYITLEIHPEKAVENQLISRMNTVVEKLKKDNKESPAIAVEKNVGIMTFSSDKAALDAENMLLGLGLSVSVKREANKLLTHLTDEEIKTIEREALQGNIAVLDKRLNPLGAAEIPIVPQGDRHIVIELPNVHDVAQAKSMIGKTALLEIKVVEEMGTSQDELLKKYDGKLPDNLMIVQGKEREHSHGIFYVVPKHAELTGSLLKDAFMDMGGDIGGEPVVKFVFNREGGDKFYDMTSKNIGRHIAIIIDNVVLTAPSVRTAIGAEGMITGSFTTQDAQDLATMLKSGAFVAPVTFEHERYIGPSLGYQSIRSGLLACLIGLLALLIFSLIIYKTAGFFAFIVLLYNLLIILFAMGFLGATLTLPGIAGMLLTIGMAIDASILIFERMREELATGAPLRKAVNTGFSGALAVIMDANITHFLVALVLYKLGAGPIKGFAIAMIIGIISTLLTGILLLKSIFNFVIDGLGVQKLKI